MICHAALEFAKKKREGGGLEIKKGYFFNAYSPLMGGVTQVEVL